MFAILSRVGKSFMLPIALLPAAGIFLGVGASFTTPEVVSQLGDPSFLQEGAFLHSILKIMASAGDVIFGSLPVLFAIGVALGLAKREKEVAAIAGFVFYMVMNQVIATSLAVFGTTTEAGILFLGREIPNSGLASALGVSNTLAMGVFGGIIAGLITAYLSNRFRDFKMPEVLGFFGGARFIPIVSAAVAIVTGLILVVIWPFIGMALTEVGNAIVGLGSFASFLHGIIERALIPFGLHHVYYTPLWFTEVGGTEIINGVTVAGTNNQFFEHLSNGSLVDFTSTNFMTGKFPFMIFGLPGAALAMYHTAFDGKKKLVGGLVFSAAFTAALTGITEPIEFAFLFAAPALYFLVHVPLAGLSFFLMDILNVRIGMTFSGGLIDFFLFGILPGNEATNWIMVPLVGIVYFFLYYFIFKFAIIKFDLKTPGREDEDTESAAKDYTDSELAEHIIDALGGIANIDEVDACITRLRITVLNGDLVQPNEFWISELGSKGLIAKGKGVQAIYGARAALLKNEIQLKLK